MSYSMLFLNKILRSLSFLIVTFSKKEGWELKKEFSGVANLFFNKKQCGDVDKCISYFLKIICFMEMLKL